MVKTELVVMRNCHGDSYTRMGTGSHCAERSVKRQLSNMKFKRQVLRYIHEAAEDRTNMATPTPRCSDAKQIYPSDIPCRRDDSRIPIILLTSVCVP